MLSCFIDSVPFSVTELTPSGSTYTWGTLGSNDCVFVALSYGSTNGSAVNVTSVDIGGTSATIDAVTSATGPGGALVAHAKPTTTSGTITPSSTGSNGNTLHTSVYKITNFSAIVNTSSQIGSYTSTGGLVQTTVTTVNGGAAISAKTITGLPGSTAEEVSTTGANKTFNLSTGGDGSSNGSLYIAAASFS